MLQLSRKGEEETDRAGNRPGKEEDGSSDERRGSENSSSDSDSDSDNSFSSEDSSNYGGKVNIVEIWSRRDGNVVDIANVCAVMCFA